MRNPLRSSAVHVPLFLAIYLTLLGGPLAISFLLKDRLTDLFGFEWWQVPLWLTCISALIVPFVYGSLQRQAQARIMERQQQYQRTLIQAAQGMTLIKEMRRLLNLIVHILTRTVGVEQASLWLLDKKLGKFTMQASRGRLPFEASYTVAVSHPMVQYLVHQKNPIVFDQLLKNAALNGNLKHLIPVGDEMTRLGAAIVIPSFVGDRLLGFVGMGPKRSRQSYTSQDQEVFEVLSNQAALAIENAQFYEDLKTTQAELFQTAKLASLGQMAGGMSHQVNNRFHVLTILAGTIKSVMKDMDPAAIPQEKLKVLWAKTLETFDKIEENALRGGDIVKTLLRFSRPSGEYKAVPVQQIIKTAKDVVQFGVNLGLLEVSEEIPETLPPVRGDLNQLADCCFNLISNAHDAIQKKAELIQEKKLSPSPKDPAPFRGRLGIRARDDGKEKPSRVIIEIQDNGIGMTQDELEHIFVPFFTTKATTQKGTGLGLYVIHRIMEQHGGIVTASSEHGVGTTFTLQLPIDQEGALHA